MDGLLLIPRVSVLNRWGFMFFQLEVKILALGKEKCQKDPKEGSKGSFEFDLPESELEK